MTTIYADVLIVLNIYVNFFLLRITAALTHSPLKTGRCIAASAYGSIFSLMILLPDISSVLNILIKLAAAVTIVAAAFGIKSRKRLLINTAAFFTANFILAGIVYAVYSWLRPQFMHFGNTYFYVDFSLAVLIVTTAASYFAVRAARTFLDKTPEDCGMCSVTVKYKGRCTHISGLADTGNALVDLFTGSPVIICDISLAEEITGASVDISALPRGFRLLPCTTVSESGMIPVFRPDEILIEDKRSGEAKKVDALIGFGTGCGEAIYNPKLIKI